MTDVPPASGDLLLVEHADGFWFACIHVPDKRNALADGVVTALGGVLRRVAADPEARALVLSGARGNFCAGADIGGFERLLAAARQKRAPAWQAGAPSFPAFL